VPIGKRAISIVFDEVIGSGALVQPGDHVDVLAFFELSVKDFSLQDNAGQSSQDTSGGDNQSQDSYDYKQYASTYVVQDVEVLAVSQALSPDELGVDGQASVPTPTPDASATETADPEATVAPVARPGAKSVTLAVTPEQAQRLFLASQTVKNEKGSLRLAMRAPGDTTTADLRPAQLGNIPLGDLLGDVDQPMVPNELVIVSAVFKERILPSGGLLEFTATVKNVSDHTIKSGKDAPPEYAYTQGIAYDALGFFPEKGTYRIGLNVAGAYPNQFPYRWGLGRDLEPGESIEVVGSVRLTEPTPDTRYWLGIIQESNVVTQDGVNVADITVVQSENGTVAPETAIMRATANDTSGIVLELKQGDELNIVRAQGAWFQVRFGQKEGWIRADALNVPPLGGEPAVAQTDSETQPGT
jgi:Flp pilus assembly protein CpaB